MGRNAASRRAGQTITTKTLRGESGPKFEATFGGPNALLDAEAALADAGMERDPKREPDREMDGPRLLKRTWHYEPKDFSGIEVTATEQTVSGRVVIVVKSSQPFSTKATAAVESLRACEGECALRNQHEAKATVGFITAVHEGAIAGQKAAALYIARLQTATKAHPDQDREFATFAAARQFVIDAGFKQNPHVITRGRTQVTFFENEAGERRALIQHMNFDGKLSPSTHLSAAPPKSAAPFTNKAAREAIFERKLAEGRAKLDKLKAKSIEDQTVYERSDAEAWNPYALAEDFADTILRARGFEKTHQPVRGRDGRKWAFYVTSAPTDKDPYATAERVLIIDVKGETATIRVPKTPMGLRPNRDRVDQETIEARAGFRGALAKMARPRDWYDDLPPGMDSDVAREAHARYQDAITTKPQIGAMAKIIVNRSRQLLTETKEASASAGSTGT